MFAPVSGRLEVVMTIDLTVKRRLESKLKLLATANGWRDAIQVAATSDVIDKTQQAYERELASRGLDRQAAEAREIRAALERIRDGNYGICLECEEEISEKRLAAVPWTALCLACQHKAELKLDSGNADELLAA
jgi:DnaK suppressor protein